MEAVWILPSTEETNSEPVLLRFEQFLLRCPEKKREDADVVQFYLHQYWAEVVHDAPYCAAVRSKEGQMPLGIKCKEQFKLWPCPWAKFCTRSFRDTPLPSFSDIDKLYLQIDLHPEDKDVLTRVGFTLSCPIFLAMKLIRQHAKVHGKVNSLTD
ncbi:hypothetical protein T4A_1281 [Trichinella pseudospiralis]|uniref:Uncharacterized protein n=1 Tax=Trichinella pseudospiralis TaxID=6337 RepID=A0A0V1E4J3_TRIPS|nr:hypothetical protein T4A_1281 [Trichinella pseudospiralis]